MSTAITNQGRRDRTGRDGEGRRRLLLWNAESLTRGAVTKQKQKRASQSRADGCRRTFAPPPPPLHSDRPAQPTPWRPSFIKWLLHPLHLLTVGFMDGRGGRGDGGTEEGGVSGSGARLDFLKTALSSFPHPAFTRSRPRTRFFHYPLYNLYHFSSAPPPLSQTKLIRTLSWRSREADWSSC